MARPRIYDAEEIAVDYRRTFHNREPTEEFHFPWNWPSRMQNVGDSLAVAYESDKWKPKGDLELYKHLAESRNKIFVLPGFLRGWDDTSEKIDVVGPTVSFSKTPMPKHFAHLDTFVEANIELYAGVDEQGPFFDGDDGIMKVTVPNGKLGGTKIRWSQVSDEEDEPFLFVYTDRLGPLMIIVGEELDIEKDGIVG